MNKNYRPESIRENVSRTVVGLLFLAILGVGPGVSVQSKSLTLAESLDRALRQTGRGNIIAGNLEVAEQEYFAEKINFYVPELSINGSLPAYSVSETYDFFPGTDVKGFGRTTRMDFDADITLRQNLITGGSLTLRANLVDNDWDYPLRGSRLDDSQLVFFSRTIDEQRRLGTFNFLFEQPILKPSDAKHELHNANDDLELARIEQVNNSAELKREVIQSFFGLVQALIAIEKGKDQLESAQLRAGIDSIKVEDGIANEEQWLESAANRLDAQLGMYEQENNLTQMRRDLMTLLDWEPGDPLDPMTPAEVEQLADTDQQAYLRNWSESLPIRKARFEHTKATRAADYAASAHGLTGSVRASYGLERGTVEDTRAGLPISEDLKTDSWGLSLNFSYPLWDGGASSASVKAARLNQEQSRLELQKAEKSAQADILNLVNQANLGYRKLDVMRRQVELAQKRRKIAQSRMDDGQISRLTFLESRVSFHEARDRYFEEMKSYYLARVDLESRYAD